jgi:hypothetical protein
MKSKIYLVYKNKITPFGWMVLKYNNRRKGSDKLYERHSKNNSRQVKV